MSGDSSRTRKRMPTEDEDERHDNRDYADPADTREDGEPLSWTVLRVARRFGLGLITRTHFHS